MHNATMAMRGALLPLDDLMPTLGVAEDEMTKAWDYNVWRGKRWAIPRSDNPTIMLYNRRMVEEAGMPDPAELWEQGKWDIEAFDATMEAVSQGEGEERVYGCDVIGGGSIRVQCIWLWGNDATVWNAEETETLINSPQAIEAWDYMTSSVTKGWAPTPAASNIPGGTVAMMGQRRLCMDWPGAQFVLGGQAQYIPEDVMAEMHLVPLNTLWNGKREVRNATNSHGINPNSQHIDEAWKMCQYFVSDDAQFRLLQERWTSPIITRLAESDAWLGSLDPNLETPEMWADSFNNIRAFPHLPRVQEIDDLIQAAKDKVIVGEASAQASMDEVVPKINAILAEVTEELIEVGL
jgi:ABC-type glycerol-3-phosphate transport system substrate-binding protein